MITLQNIIFPDEVCPEPAIYFRMEHAALEDHAIHMEAEGVIRTDTYMNALDFAQWREATAVKDIWLQLEYAGQGELAVRKTDMQGNHTTVWKKELNTSYRTTEQFLLQENPGSGLYYWEIRTSGAFIFYQGKYMTSAAGHRNDIKLALNICTYRREAQLQNNIKKLKESPFFRKDSEWNGKIQLFIVDNGGTLPVDDTGTGIHIYHNSNEGGGSGGFTRGLKEIRSCQDKERFTHVTFMDDDVEIQTESLFRLITYLSFLQDNRETTAVAGRMFRLDQRMIQYTAAEIWHAGDIRHVNGGRNMTRPENILETQPIEGEYGGWWFCTYPASYALQNKPFPFFLHCDDVEYGLRFPGRTVALKGVQVWHETYEHRISPDIVYYDVRNMLIVNTIYGDPEDKEEIIRQWKERLTAAHNTGDQSLKYMCILAMYHFGKGMKVLNNGGALPDIHKQMARHTQILKILLPPAHRYIERNIRKNFEKIQREYKREGKSWQS